MGRVGGKHDGSCAGRARHPPSLRGLTQRRDRFVCCTVAHDLRESIAEFFTRLFGTVMRLEVHPALWVDAEKCTETNGGISRDGAFPLHNFIDTTCRYLYRLRERVLSNAHWGEPFFREDLAGCVEWNFANHK